MTPPTRTAGPGRSAPVDAPAPVVPSLPLYDSSARRRPALEELILLCQYRDLVVQLVRRDLVMRYKRSLLGVFWTLLNPLGTMVILTLVFSNAFGAGRTYPVYALTGLLAWNFFAQTTVGAIRQLTTGAQLIRRIYMPRTVFAVSVTGTGLLNLLVGLVPLFAIMLVSGMPIRPTILFLPVSIAVLAACALGVGLAVSVLAVHFTDTADLYAMVLPAVLYLTPVIYPREILPVSAHPWLVDANPAYHLVTLFRAPLYDGRLPGLASVAIAVGAAATTLVLGWVIFTARADKLAARM